MSLRACINGTIWVVFFNPPPLSRINKIKVFQKEVSVARIMNYINQNYHNTIYIYILYRKMCNVQVYTGRCLSIKKYHDIN